MTDLVTTEVDAASREEPWRHDRTPAPLDAVSRGVDAGIHGESAAGVEDEFDELEAASQELHDICFAMIAFLRKADPEATESLYERRCRRRLREPVPVKRRRLVHGHGDRSAHPRNNFDSANEFYTATDAYVKLGEKLLVLLDKAVMDRILESAGRRSRNQRGDGVHRYRHILERASWRSFPHHWYKHAPFEVQQLRADIPDSAVKNTRGLRDTATLQYLITLTEPQHPYRERIEKRVAEIATEYDPHRTKV